MTTQDNTDELVAELRSTISKYLDVYVSEPTFETASKEILGQARIASLIAMVRIIADMVEEVGVGFDKDYLRSLPKKEIEDRITAFGVFIESKDLSTIENEETTRTAMEFMQNDSSKKYLVEYVVRETHWISVSLLSASYISSFVLMRAFFELIVGIATRETGGMTDRIMSIHGFREEEKKELKKLWDRLCAWGHPYGEWFKEVCPIYVSHKPLFHSRLFSLSLRELIRLVDFFAVVAIRRFDLDTSVVRDRLTKGNIDIEEYYLLQARIAA